MTTIIIIREPYCDSESLGYDRQGPGFASAELLTAIADIFYFKPCKTPSYLTICTRYFHFACLQQHFLT